MCCLQPSLGGHGHSSPNGPNRPLCDSESAKSEHHYSEAGAPGAMLGAKHLTMTKGPATL
eukprot:9513943-Alexandrium_andersonii.AAC.1